ncbi:hypothetical protein OV090_40065 [Nannocystis sp. RBIL2]|uniref:hypothetical protein n=1 Tax=Nannocystis sp. RBIL2 TaxID=2996788 RepID=UPI00226D9416|nr:hypothetical protein [Nannocystis sp. RBIL2]MCY1071006.1 hypothetical protein [Nannocystis sp. RBIL2]
MPIYAITMPIGAITMPIYAITMDRSGRSRWAVFRSYDSKPKFVGDSPRIPPPISRRMES